MTQTRTTRFTALLTLAAMFLALAAPHAAAAGEKYTISHTDEYDYGRPVTVTTEETVDYQLGSKVITVQAVQTTVENGVTTWVTRETYTYILTGAVKAAAPQDDWGIVFDVPADTVITCNQDYNSVSYSEYGSNEDSGSNKDINFYWNRTSRVLPPEMLYGWDADPQGAILGSDSGIYLQVGRGKIYQLYSTDSVGDAVVAAGGIVFRGV